MIKTINKFILFSAISILFFFTSCKTEYISFFGYTQGTTYNIKLNPTTNINSSEIDSILLLVDSTFSIYNKQSIISKVNRNEDHKLNKYLLDLFFISEHLWQITDGYFDITLGALVQYWGFTPKEVKLENVSLDSLKQLTGMRRFELANNKVIKEEPKLLFDLNAIAQGYSVDMVAEYFESKGINDYLIEIGGEIRAKGVNQNNNIWKIGIDKPVEFSTDGSRELQVIVNVNNKSIATSGSYRKFFEKDGMKYSHTINPKTGLPTQHNLLSVTIITDLCSAADGIATALMAMGLDLAKDFLNINKEYDALLIYSNQNGEFETWQTKGFEKLIYQE